MLASAAMLAACSLGVVDLPATPRPAELFVVSEIGADATDPSQVEIVVTATLDPGIGSEGMPRRLVGDAFSVEGTEYRPSTSGDPERPMWRATLSAASPGPEAVQLRLPRLEGLGLAPIVNMRVRVAVEPESTIVLGEGEDLVLRAEPPSNPAQTLEWSFELTSPSVPAFRLRLGGAEGWPSEVRVPAADIPLDALPMNAELRIQWDRSLSVFELTPEERYDLSLRSIMVVAATVETAG